MMSEMSAMLCRETPCTDIRVGGLGDIPLFEYVVEPDKLSDPETHQS